MKKIVLALILAAGCVALCACDNGNSSGGSSDQNGVQNEVTKSPSEKAAELLEKVEFPEMVELSGEMIVESFLGIAESDLSEYHGYRCVAGAHPDEFGILVANDLDTAVKLKDAVGEWVEYQIVLYRDYTPSEVYKLEDSFVILDEKTCTITYAICDNNALAREILN